MKRSIAALAATLAGCAAMPEHLPPSDAPGTLASAESAFAAQSVREGMRAAFLAWLAPDATLFRDGPVNGPAAMDPVNENLPVTSPFSPRISLFFISPQGARTKQLVGGVYRVAVVSPWFSALSIMSDNWPPAWLCNCLIPSR